MIKTFADIKEISDNDDEAFSSEIIDELTDEEIVSLQSSVDGFDNEMVNVYKAAARAYLKPPIDFLKGVLKNNLNLAYEAYLGSIDDTYPRDMLIDAILQSIGMTNSWWPSNQDKDDTLIKFVIELRDKCAIYNIEIIEKIPK